MTPKNTDTNREVPVKGRAPGYAHLERRGLAEKWVLVINRTQGIIVRIPLGTCICHRSLDCPVGAQEATARRILRGDQPSLFHPPPLKGGEA